MNNKRIHNHVSFYYFRDSAKSYIITKYNIDSKEVELEVVESSDASCEGCAFNNSKNYYCKDTHCIDVDRKDDIDVIYKKVKRS